MKIKDSAAQFTDRHLESGGGGISEVSDWRGRPATAKHGGRRTAAFILGRCPLSCYIPHPTNASLILSIFDVLYWGRRSIDRPIDRESPLRTCDRSANVRRIYAIDRGISDAYMRSIRNRRRIYGIDQRISAAYLGNPRRIYAIDQRISAAYIGNPRHIYAIDQRMSAAYITNVRRIYVIDWGISAAYM